MYFRNVGSIDTPSKIQLYNNKQPNILKHIQSTSFLTLKQLNLKNNKITTIQHLTNLHAPLLQSLNLSDNNITKICGAMKKNIFCLRSLKLYANNIVEMLDDVGMGMGMGMGMEIVLGINYIVDFRGLNKMIGADKIIFSMENNRGGSIITANQLKHWKANPANILI